MSLVTDANISLPEAECMYVLETHIAADCTKGSLFTSQQKSILSQRATLPPEEHVPWETARDAMLLRIVHPLDQLRRSGGNIESWHYVSVVPKASCFRCDNVPVYRTLWHPCHSLAASCGTNHCSLAGVFMIRFIPLASLQ